MSSSTMPEAVAIQLDSVSKVYKLYSSQRDQLMDVLGLGRFGIHPKVTPKEFVALKDISIEIRKGQRVGVVGRNGAGKTTLLKLICGNFSPTSGRINVNGEVQALMNVGLGFHPEYTGRQNVEASLQYNGIEKKDYKAAIEDIIDFCELGDFIDQPFKSYSLGMQARLMFASATTIRPDILIVDEVLGAGDAYFVAKSKQRVQKLVESGCTMLLVSHSMGQILELCSEAIWIDQGAIRMKGDAFLVVKAYEEYMHGPVAGIKRPPTVPKVAHTGLPESNSSKDISADSLPEVSLQEPAFRPHQDVLSLSDKTVAPDVMKFTARGGISRWAAEIGIKVCGFSIVTTAGETNQLISLQPAKVVMHVVGEIESDFSVRYGMLISDPMGRNVAVIYSPIDRFHIREGQVRKVSIGFNPLQLGPGDYTIGISVLDGTSIEGLNHAKRYDLLGRSFDLSIRMPDTLNALTATVLHSAEWEFS